MDKVWYPISELIADAYHKMYALVLRVHLENLMFLILIK